MMAPISTKRRNEQSDEPRDDQGNDIPVSIFDALRDHPLAPREEQEEQQEKPEDKTASLMAELATLRGELTALQNQNDRMQTPVVVPDMGTEPTLNLEGLPDPVIDSKGYTQGFAQRLLSHQEALRDWHGKQTATKGSQSNQLEELWTDFGESHPDYAEANSKRIEFAVKAVTDRARNRGIDLNRYMLGNRERFFSDVAKEYDAVFGAPGGGDEEQGNDLGQIKPQRKRTRVARQELGDDDPGRTGGVFGGSESGGAPTRGRQKDQPGDMLKDIRDLQVKGGFY